MPIKGLRPRQLGPPESFEDVHERQRLSDAPEFIYSSRRGTRTLSRIRTGHIPYAGSGTPLNRLWPALVRRW
ncbi:hypothetical protein DPV78_003394 [Talaromyces pinophilus]|nr:hypothetical protein DPV78_003394 [Talaromyces pinophilus]